ncbi:MAG: ABC transporter ATP-binding protein [Pseudomonadota bacterium]
MTECDAAIAVKGLAKVYGTSRGAPPIRALDGIDLVVPRGSIFALLGPNGAGKSTFINILAGLVTKTTGSAAVWGWDIDHNPRNAKASIGVVPQELYFDAFFTPLEMLEFQAGMYGVPKRQRRSMDLLRAMRLDDKAHAYSRTLSGGMKRRLLVAKAMVHNPPVLILDEPTAGVDIELRQHLWAYVRDLNARGVTIVLTTHYLEEAQALCDRIAIINHGRVVCCEEKAALLARIAEKQVTIRLAEPLAEWPQGLARFKPARLADNAFTIQYDAQSTPIGEILAAVMAAGLSIADLSTKETDLEDIFLQLTARKAA